jgi:sec-independent protein translocase protein TatA
MDLGPMELVLVLGLVVVLFGAGRIAELGGALGKSVREFRSAMHEGDDQPAQASETRAPGATPLVPAAAQPSARPSVRDFLPRDGE